MLRRSALLAAISLGVVWVLPGVSCLAQQPKFRLDTLGPTSQVRVLAFSSDNHRLYSAGKDKVVRTWDIVEANGQVRLVPGHKFRWEISRRARGHIYDLAIDANSKLIAFAGYSAWTNQTDVSIYSLETRKLVKKLFTDPAQGGTIVDVEFSPAGKKLAAISESGELRMWATDSWKQSLLEPPGEKVLLFRPLLFQTENFLVTVNSANGGDGQLVFRDLLKGTKTTHQFRHQLVQSIKMLGSTLVTADRNGDIMLWAAGKSGTRLRKSTENPHQVITSLAATPDGRLIVVLANKKDLSSATIEYWDAKKNQLLERKQFSTEPSWTIACSPNGRFAAVCEGEKNEIRLYPLTHGTGGQLIDKPFHQDPVCGVAGEGLRTWNVYCSPESGTFNFGFTTTPNAQSITSTFDPSNSRLVARKLALNGWRSANTDAGPFSIRTTDDPYRFQVLLNGQAHGEIVLDQLAQGLPSSHCWIALPGEDKPAALAIGTQDQNGIFIYDIRGQGNLPLRRYFRDHEGIVTSLATTADHKYLVSTSRDQTAKVWSLAGILDSPATFSRQSDWGAVLEKQTDGTLVVRNAIKSGIAHARKLVTGATIVGIQNFSGVNATTADAMLQVIQENKAWQGLLVSFRAPGDEKVNRVIITPAWEPLLTMFFAQTGEWAAWTPVGYYNSSPLGDELFGWQLNAERQTEGELQFFRADQFRGDFERPELIERLLAAGDVETALSKNETPDQPPVVPVNHGELAEEVPKLQIVSPRDNDQLEGASLELEASVNFPDPAQIKHFEIRGSLQGAYLGPPSIKRVGSRLECRWTTEMPVGFNQFKVRVTEVSGKKLYGSDQVFFRSKASRSTDALPKLFVVGIAANRYFGDLALRFPVKDVQSILDRLPDVASEHYDPEPEFFYQNQEITREAFPEKMQEVLSELEENAKPEDLLIVYISGHGATQNGEYFFMPPTPELTSRDLLNEQGVTSGIRWDEIVRLTDAPCRTVFMLDTCYAGDILAGAESKNSSAGFATGRGCFVVVRRTELVRGCGGTQTRSFFILCAGSA